MSAPSLRQNAHATMRSLSHATAQFPSKAVRFPQIYANYVASNTSTVSQVENTLRSLTYLVPGARFQDSELASESLNTFIQLLSLYHDHILKHRSSILSLQNKPLERRSLPKPKATNHARYTNFWSDTSSTYTKVAILLKITQYTELLWEMMAKRSGGERTRWRAVVLLESFKALCRLILLRLTKLRPLVQPPLPEREAFAPPESEEKQQFDEEELKMSQENGDFDAKNAFGEQGMPTPPVSESDKVPAVNPAEPFNMPRTGTILPSLPSPELISAYLLNHVITADDVKPAKQLLHRLTSLQGQMAEVLYILRPVIYALLMQRVARRYGYEGEKWRKNWTPWLAGVTIEYLARTMAKRDLQFRIPGGMRSGLSALERDEFSKRGWNMAWWTMRGSFYENITKRYIHGFAESLRGKPLLDLVGGVVQDYEFLWSNYYFTTATM